MRRRIPFGGPLVLAALVARAAPAGAGGNVELATDLEDAEIGKLLEMGLEELLDITVASSTLSTQSARTAPSIVTVITREQMRAFGLDTLAEALRMIAGVSVVDTQSGVPDLIVRGSANPANILVSLDGQRLNDFYDGAVILDFPIDSLDRIEVVRGPGSSLYGTGAYAGVVSMYSDDKAPTEFELRGGGYRDQPITNDLEASGTYNGRAGGWDLRLHAAVRESPGARVPVEKDHALGTDYSAAPGETSDHVRLGMLCVSGGRAGLLADADRLDVEAALVYAERGPYFGQQNVFTPDSEFERRTALAHVKYELPLGQALVLKTTLGYDTHLTKDRIEDQPPGFFEDVDRDFTVDPGEVFPEGKWRRVRHGSHRLSGNLIAFVDTPLPFVVTSQFLVGGEVEYDWLPDFRYRQNYEAGLYREGRLRNYDRLPIAQRDAERTVVAGFAQERMEIVSGLWLTLGARYDRYSDFGDTLNPRLAIVWTALPQLAVKALYGRAFRAPTFKELYDYTSFTYANSPLIGNAELKPEVTDTTELGVTLTPVQGIELQTTGFYTRTRDNIDLDATIGLDGREYINYPGRQITGVEQVLHLYLSRDTYLIANASWMKLTQLGRGLSGWETVTHRRFGSTDLTDVPRLRANVMATGLVLDWLRLGVRYGFVGETRNNARFPIEAFQRGFEREAYHEAGLTALTSMLGGRVIVDLQIERTFRKYLPISLGVAEQYNLPAPSLAVFLGVHLQP